MDYIDLGGRIRSVRHQLKMTQEQLAEAVGISASFLGHIERGTRVASLETLVALCNTMKVSPEYLLEGSLHIEPQFVSQDVSPHNRDLLKKFLRLAENTVSHWKE